MMDKQHIANTIIVVVLLAFAFSYRFEGAFTLSNWLATFFVTFVLVAFSVSMHKFAKIALAGTLTSLFIAVGAQLLTPFLGQIAEILVKINVAIGISNLIPFL